MSNRLRLALSFTLAFSAFPILAQTPDEAPTPWATSDVESAQAQCRANLTATGIEGPKVERYCQCATDALQQRFTATEVRRMRREHNPSDSEDTRPPKLAKALEQCSPVLESQ
ncbi:hypothetical protein [Salinicola avicenniae]|uniref:hypothetical protein n=1 Tax=Salinicola avicenniae TaxID=2916836 RepID=UPI0020732354|nr:MULTISPECIES: hypothetical protein [unclassified Salinicola]